MDMIQMSNFCKPHVSEHTSISCTHNILSQPLTPIIDIRLANIYAPIHPGDSYKILVIQLAMSHHSQFDAQMQQKPFHSLFTSSTSTCNLWVLYIIQFSILQFKLCCNMDMKTNVGYENKCGSILFAISIQLYMFQMPKIWLKIALIQSYCLVQKSIPK